MYNMNGKKQHLYTHSPLVSLLVTAAKCHHSPLTRKKQWILSLRLWSSCFPEEEVQISLYTGGMRREPL